MARNARSATLAQRDELILQLLQERGFVSVSALATQLNVSDMTVRRDLRRLEALGNLTVVHGGASLATARSGNGFDARSEHEHMAKAAIAAHAAELVDADASVLMDAGTTVLQVAQHLGHDFGGYIITHSIPVVDYFSDSGVHLHCLGGELHQESRALIGPTTIENLAKVRADVVFLGAAAVTSAGIFIAKDLERSTKMAMLASAGRVVVVADHSKFDAAAPVRLIGLDRVDVVVTDASMPDHLRTATLEANVDVHVAKSSALTPR